MFQEMLKKKRGNSTSQISAPTGTPTQRELPHAIRVSLNKLAHFDDGLPSRVFLVGRGGNTGQ